MRPDLVAVPIGAALTLAGSAVYAVRALRGAVSPDPLTWLFWTIAPGVAFAAELSHGVGMGSLTTLAVGLGPLLVCVCALTGGAFRWAPTRYEWACGAFALLALLGWWTTANPDVALLLSILADGLAAVPTLLKAHRRPDTEDPWVYALMAVSAALTLCTTPAFTFAATAFPAYLLVLCGTTLVLLRRPRSDGRISAARRRDRSRVRPRRWCP